MCNQATLIFVNAIFVSLIGLQDIVWHTPLLLARVCDVMVQAAIFYVSLLSFLRRLCYLPLLSSGYTPRMHLTEREPINIVGMMEAVAA